MNAPTRIGCAVIVMPVNRVRWGRMAVAHVRQRSNASRINQKLKNVGNAHVRQHVAAVVSKARYLMAHAARRLPNVIRS